MSDVNVTNQVAKVRASDGEVLGVFAANVSPRGVTFDGELIWIAGSGSNNVICMDQDGTIKGTYQAGSEPRGVCFDGLSVWAANSGRSYLYKY